MWMLREESDLSHAWKTASNIMKQGSSSMDSFM